MDDPTAPNDALAGYLRPMLSARSRTKVGALGLLRLLEPARTGLRDYERQLVAVARSEGKTWDEIGEALSVPRQTAHRRWSHVG